jgi:hypothetical protein
MTVGGVKASAISALSEASEESDAIGVLEVPVKEANSS